MDIAETSRSTEFISDSILSTWSGPATLVTPAPLSSVRESDDLVKAETADWTKRLLCLTDYHPVGTSLGPGLSPDYGYLDVLHIARFNYLPLMAVAPHYTGFRYDAIEIRVSISAPKALVGGVFVGWYPFVDYYDENVQGTIDVYLDNAFAPNCMQFLNTTNTQLMLQGRFR